MLNNIMDIMNYYDLEGCYEMTMDTNEYEYEAKEIMSYIENCNYMSIELMIFVIKFVFNESFGGTSYHKEVLKDMAKDIVELID